MSILLSGLPRKTRYTPRPVRASTSVLSPAFGGADLPLARKGDRWSVDVDTGPMDLSCSASLFADLARSGGETVCIDLPSTGSDPALPADPAVSGAGQAGSLLNLKNFPAAYPIRKGRFFTVITGGRRYVYIVTAATVASGGGLATVAFWPMLRAQPANNDVVEFIRPRIEGFVHTPTAMTGDDLPAFAPEQFTIKERA